MSSTETGSSGETLEISPRATLLGHTSWSLRCTISGDGERAISGDGQPTARIWNLNDLSDSKLLGEEIGIRQCSLSHDGSLAAIAGTGANGCVTIYDTKTGRKLFEIRAPKKGMSPAGCALTPDGTVLAATFRASNRSKGSIRITRWRENPVMIAEIDRPYSIWSIFLSHDARRAAYKFWHGTVSGIELIDPWNDRLFFNLPMPSSEWAFSMDRQASVIVTASEWALRAIPMSDPDAVKTLPGYTFSSFAHCSVSADGMYVSAPVRDCKFGIWHLPSGTLTHMLLGHSDRTNGCSISADGSRLITCSNDRSVRLWDANHIDDYTPSNGGEPIILRSLRLILDGNYKMSLTSPSLQKILSPENVHTVVDLLFAHTILMISKRTRHVLGADTYPIEESMKMYNAVHGKLHSTIEAFLAQILMLHAEQHKLLPEGFAYQKTGSAIHASKQMIDDLKTTLMRCWRLAFSLPKTPVHSKLENQLTMHLNSVFDDIDTINRHDNERNITVFCAVSRACLFFHPEFLSTLDDFNREISNTIPSPDLLHASPLTGLSFLDKMAPFDISSPDVLAALMSKDFVSMLAPKSKKAVVAAISKSFFHNETIAKGYLMDLTKPRANPYGIHNIERDEQEVEEAKSDAIDTYTPENEVETESAKQLPDDSTSTLQRAENKNPYASPPLLSKGIRGPEEEEAAHSSPLSSRIQLWEKSAVEGQPTHSPPTSISSRMEPRESEEHAVPSPPKSLFSNGIDLSEKEEAHPPLQQPVPPPPEDTTPPTQDPVVPPTPDPKPSPPILEAPVETTRRNSVEEVAGIWERKLSEKKLAPGGNETIRTDEDANFKVEDLPDSKTEEETLKRELAPIPENLEAHKNLSPTRSSNSVIFAPYSTDKESSANEGVEVEETSTTAFGSVKSEEAPNLENYTRTSTTANDNTNTNEITTSSASVDADVPDIANEITTRNEIQKKEEVVILPVGAGDGVVKKVDMEKMIRESIEKNQTENPPVMNINVYIVTEDQKVVSATPEVSNGSIATSTDFTAKLVSEDGTRSEMSEKISNVSIFSTDDPMKEEIIVVDDELDQEEEENEESKVKKKKSARKKLKKNMISFAKGTRNTFYGKKKSKEPKENKEVDTEIQEV